MIDLPRGTRLNNKRRSLLLNPFDNLKGIKKGALILQKRVFVANMKGLKTYQIEIVETMSSILEITAEDEQDALLKVQERYRNEEVILYPDDFIDTKFNIFPSN